MGELKTKRNDGSVEEFLRSIEDPEQASDCRELVEVMGRLTSAEPEMYGSSIVGFGTRTITYADGRQEPWFSVGFSPRKGKLSLYIVDEAEEHRGLLERLGPHKTGKSCIWVKRLRDIDLQLLEELISRGNRE